MSNEIDKSLDNNDQDMFIEMSKILQFINELEEHR
ncbi:IDEAL domain-containing protein [Mammaliicoccus sciuri]